MKPQGLDVGRIRAVLFDIDGTLADTHEALAIRLAAALRPMAGWLPGNDLLDRARRLLLATETPVNAVYALCDRLGIDELVAPVLDALHWMRGEARSSSFLLMPGVPGLLEALRGRFPMGIVSARDRRGVHAFLEQFDLARHFACVATARTCRRTKPHPAPVVWAAEALDLSPEACVLVGDTVVDVRAGTAAGAQTVGVLCGFGERDELRRAGADLILPSTSDLAEALGLHRLEA